MLVGCRSEEIPGQVVLFSSKDLKEWKFETILAENSTGEIGVMWECPDFFPLGDKHVLICSPQHMRAKGYEFIMDIIPCILREIMTAKNIHLKKTHR